MNKIREKIRSYVTSSLIPFLNECILDDELFYSDESKIDVFSDNIQQMCIQDLIDIAFIQTLDGTIPFSTFMDNYIQIELLTTVYNELQLELLDDNYWDIFERHFLHKAIEAYAFPFCSSSILKNLDIPLFNKGTIEDLLILGGEENE